MFKKRLLAFGLAGVMVMGLNMSVLAETQDITTEGEKSTPVSANIPETYTVTIPSTISRDALRTGIQVLGKSNLKSGTTVTVSVLANEIEMTRTVNDNKVESPVENIDSYKLTLKGLTGLTIGTLTDYNIDIATNIGSKIFGEDPETLKVKAGDYTGTVIFNITKS